MGRYWFSAPFVQNEAEVQTSQLHESPVFRCIVLGTYLLTIGVLCARVLCTYNVIHVFLTKLQVSTFEYHPHKFIL